MFHHRKVRRSDLRRQIASRKRPTEATGSPVQPDRHALSRLRASEQSAKTSTLAPVSYNEYLYL